MSSITQDMKYRQSLMKYAEKYGVSRASRKYNKARSYIYFWKARWDGTVESLRCQSRRPHSHPNQHTEEELKLIRDMRRRNPTLGLPELWYRLCKRGYTRRPESLFRVMRRLGLRLFQYTAIDEYSRLRFLGAYEEQSTYSSADFLEKMTAWFRRRGVAVECVQTDNGFEFTNRFSNSKKDIPTLFENTAARLGIHHKLIRPYTPRHNGKVEGSRREDQKRLYDSHRFFSLADFGVQLAAHQNRSNLTPMRPLNRLSPVDALLSFTVQLV